MITQKERPVNIILFMIYINFIYNYSNSARIPLAVQVDEGRALGNPTFDPDEDQGDFDLEAQVRSIGQDLLVAIWGGEKPHIGAVSIAQPRPSLRDPKSTSATASVICHLGHKEDELAKALSEVLAAALNTQVVVTAGIHWDNID